MFAVLLAIVRAIHSIKTPKGQWLSDATGVWTVQLLFLISLSTITNRAPFFHNLIIPPEAELIQTNGVLVPLAFSYCALMIANNLVESVRERWYGLLIVVVKFTWEKVKGRIVPKPVAPPTSE
jgi:hypothetical protein